MELPEKLADHAMIAHMAEALKGLDDLENPSKRAAAYMAAGIQPDDLMRLDLHANTAERARRSMIRKAAREAIKNEFAEIDTFIEALGWEKVA